jgi:hypothetical protein
LIIGIGTLRSTDIALHSSKKTGDTEMIARFAKVLDRAALAVFMAVAAVPVLAFPLLAVAGIH